jgi:hypothetical protein
MPRLIICKKCNFPIAGGLCLCTVGRRTPDMPNIPPPPPKRQPTELQRAQWWFCGWLSAGICDKSTKAVTDATLRLEEAIRAQAQKGEQS